MNLLGYVRVSTDDQRRNGHSLDAQPETLRRYCELHGHTLVRVITDEGVSGSVALRRRRGGKALLAALAAGEGEGVVVARLDRLFRDALDGLSFFAGHQTTVHSVSDLIDTSTPAGRLNLTITLAAAQYERDMAVARASESTRALRDAGRAYAHTPYGCVALGVAKRNGGDGATLFRDPETWPVRERLVKLRHRGHVGGGTLPYAKLAERVRAAGIPSPQGKAGWSTSALRRICESHDALSSLPWLPDSAQAATESSPAPETEVSPVTPTPSQPAAHGVPAC